MTDTPQSSDALEKAALELWEGMFGNLTEVHAGPYVITYNDFIRRFSDCIASETAKARQELEFNLVLFTAEYMYCKANGYPVGEGHEPPSMVYERMEAPVRKWLASRGLAAHQLKPDGTSSEGEVYE